jgi:hypothetical protein
MGRFLDVAATLGAIAGGIVLLTLQSADSASYSLTGHNVFGVRLHQQSGSQPHERLRGLWTRCSRLRSTT